VLLVIWKTDGIKVREISQLVGVPERTVQQIISELVDAGFVKIEKVGRANRYSVTPDVRVRRPIEQYRGVSSLLKMFSTELVHAPA
jgi:predicted transcriptional regulator